ncbi:LytR/AlgR family response regulator transcription factor [Paenibacillus rhizoplanae]
MSISVMVIDDEWPALDQMKGLLLQCEGVSSVLTYDNPHEALAAAAKLKPDVLFLDIQMPELSGLTFCREAVASISGHRHRIRNRLPQLCCRSLRPVCDGLSAEAR